ncbi:MAG: hypothetical protein ACRD0Z_05210 [Acidimicrobiales bacterium]
MLTTMGVVLLAAIAGTATAMEPIPALAVAGGAGLVLFATLSWRAVRPGGVKDHADRWSWVSLILLAYLLPMFLLSRSYSLIGFNPIYLPDVLATLAALASLGRARWRHLGVMAACCTAVSLLMLHGVDVGRHHKYPDAIKGLVLVLYPLAAVPIAGWLSQLHEPERLLQWLPRIILPVIPLGLLLDHGHHMIPSAFGLELGIAGAFAVVGGMPGRKLLTATFLMGSVMLIAYSAKRGVTLTLLLSCAAAWMASQQLRYLSRRMLLTLALGFCTALFSLAVISGFIVVPRSVPLVGRLAERASGAQVAAADNVTLRELMWSYALHTTWDDDPLLGVGAYHPIDVQLKNNNIATKAGMGVHDSFVGYTFYAGYPAGLLVIFVFLLALWRIWKVRRRSIYAPAVFGALVAAIVTAATNVSLEVTYMGGPSWLVVALAFGLSAKLMDAPDLEDGDALVALEAELAPIS